MEYLVLGPCPIDEEPCQVGEENYYIKARTQCYKFVCLLEKLFTDKPKNVKFSYCEFPHEFGSYLETIIMFDSIDPKSKEFALFVESNLPEKWEE